MTASAWVFPVPAFVARTFSPLLSEEIGTALPDASTTSVPAANNCPRRRARPAAALAITAPHLRHRRRPRRRRRPGHPRRTPPRLPRRSRRPIPGRPRVINRAPPTPPPRAARPRSPPASTSPAPPPRNFAVTQLAISCQFE